MQPGSRLIGPTIVIQLCNVQHKVSHLQETVTVYTAYTWTALMWIRLCTENVTVYTAYTWTALMQITHFIVIFLICDKERHP